MNIFEAKIQFTLLFYFKTSKIYRSFLIKKPLDARSEKLKNFEASELEKNLTLYMYKNYLPYKIKKHSWK